MAVVNTKSAPLVAADSDPQEITHSYEANGIVRSSCGAVEVAAADDDGSVYRIARLPSNARLIGRTIKNDAIAGGSDYDIGLYTVDDGAVVDADILDDGLSMTAAGGAFDDFSAIPPEKINDRLWELAGETTDPGGQYDICLTANTVGTVAGGIAVDILWTN
jgi:hypothetical protein